MGCQADISKADHTGRTHPHSVQIYEVPEPRHDSYCGKPSEGLMHASQTNERAPHQEDAETKDTDRASRLGNVIVKRQCLRSDILERDLIARCDVTVALCVVRDDDDVAIESIDEPTDDQKNG